MAHRLEPVDDVEHAFNTDNAKRCASLSVYLQSSLDSLVRDAYAPAFSVLRSCMEHVLVDKLIFLGQRYVQVFSEIDDETWSRWQAERNSGEAWQNVASWRRSNKRNVRVLFEGLHSKSEKEEERQTIGIHYFLLNEYSPFVAPPSEQEYFDDGVTDATMRRDHAVHNKSLYETYLRWLSVKESLKENGFADGESVRALDVHYRFLSAFVHPNTDATRLLYGNRTWEWPSYDHYSSELVLLYVIVLSVEETRNFLKMADNSPRVGISDRDSLEALCDQAWDMSSHLWFPGQPPHGYDRFVEANRRGFRERRSGTFDRAVNPASLSEDEISYYDNPLQRLIRMHSSASEYMTGLVYQSPWHRNDARGR
ncbi:hypothetical protein [Nocardiopsis sp. ATB16-24]|uniref:hypothetical protein n=1 Tax=Nocardiopsis sp. ATB16-24 TaxID=3019555 RepID=UPI0025544288|nr:hypothetical protein [Nocardiopsis sp. ATB16-24]